MHYILSLKKKRRLSVIAFVAEISATEFLYNLFIYVFICAPSLIKIPSVLTTKSLKKNFFYYFKKLRREYCVGFALLPSTLFTLPVFRSARIAHKILRKDIV